MSETAVAPPEAVPTPEPLTEDAQAAMRARAQACGLEIEGALRKYRCLIRPYLTTDPVGNTGDRMQVQASFGVVPQP